MKIREYLSHDADTIERIKATATFTPERGTSVKDRTQGLPPFEETIVQDIVRRWYGSDEEGRTRPSIAQIQLSSRCHHGLCLSLPDAGDTNRATSLDPRIFPPLLDSLLRLKVKWIDFSGGGEPTSHPEFGEFAQACAESGLGIGLLSDAAWSVGKMGDLVVEACSFVRVNLDACNQQVCDRLHRIGACEFEKVLRNVEKMVRQREKRKSHLVLGAETNLTQANMNFTEEIAALARDLGLDYIRFRAGQTGPDSLLPEQRERAEALLRELSAESHPFPVYHQIRLSSSARGCRISHFQLVVDPSGNLHACSAYGRRPDIRPFGNIFSRPADELWLCSEHLKTIRKPDESPCTVSDCRWHLCNHLLPDSQTGTTS